MLDFAVSGRLPALDKIDPQVGIGGIERQVGDKTKPMVNVGLVIVTVIVSHTANSIGLGNLLEQKGMIAFFNP